jgi:hypothetical protein
MPSLVRVLFHHAGCAGVARSLALFVERRSALALSALALSAVPAAAQDVEWRRMLGTSQNEAVLDSAPDGSGGVYVNGYTYGSLVAPNAGMGDGWVIRYDSSGTRLWSRQFGSLRDDWATATAADGLQGVFVAGNTTGRLDGPTASGSAWVAHLDGAGNELWLEQFGTSAKESVASAASDAAGGVLVAGRTQEVFSSGLDDAWLARFDGAGSQLWQVQLGTSSDDGIEGIAEQSGGVFVCGFTGKDLGAPSSGQVDAWVARYDLQGNQVWIRQFGTTKFDWARSIVGDAVEGVFVCGTTREALAGPYAGSEDVWLARFDGSGNQLWIQQLGTTGDDRAEHVVQDGAGGVIVVGSTDRNLAGSNAGDSDAWAVRFDGAGVRLWTKQLGSRSGDWCMTAASDSAGGAYVGGATRAGAAAGSLTYFDAWLARIAGP